MTLFWHPSGPRIRYANGVLRTDDLNPETAVAWQMSRWEMVKLGFNCVFAQRSKSGRDE